MIHVETGYVRRLTDGKTNTAIQRYRIYPCASHNRTLDAPLLPTFPFSAKS